MNFLTLKQRTLQRLNESMSSPAFWSLTDIGDFINEGYADLISSLKITEKSGTLSTVANQYIYSLASDSLGITRMYYDTSDHLIHPFSWERLQKIDRWFNETSDTYPTFRMDNVGTQKVFLWPKVITSEASCITYWYNSIPSDMSADSDSPSIQKSFHDALIDYACAVSLMRERAPESKKKGFAYMEEYTRRKGSLSVLPKNKGNRTAKLRPWI